MTCMELYTEVAAEGLNLQQVLISDLPELHEVRLQAVHFAVDLHVSQHLPSQLLLQLLLAVVDLFHPRLQLIRVVLNSGRRIEEGEGTTLVNNKQFQTWSIAVNH